MRSLCAFLFVLLSSLPALSQSSEPAARTRYSIGAAVHPASTIVTQIEGLVRIPAPRPNQFLVAGATMGMAFYSRELQKEIGAYENKAGYATVSVGVGYGPVALTIGFGARIEKRLRPTSGLLTSISWMHTLAAHGFVTEAIGIRLEYLGPRWLLVGVDVGI